MQGRLLPARGGPASPLTIREVIKAAQAKAHRDASVQILSRAVAGLVKRAEGEGGAALRSTVGSLVGPQLAQQQAQEVADTKETPGAVLGPVDQAAPPAKGLGTSWAPVEADRASTGLHEDQEKLSSLLSAMFSGELEGMTELEKQAIVGQLLARGRGLLARLRSPIRRTTVEGAGTVRGFQSPLRPKGQPPSIPKDAPAAAARTGAPYRTPGKVAPPAEKIPDLTRHAKVVKDPVKPKSLTRALLPGALMLGAGYGLYKGVPAVAGWASRAASTPMAYGMGLRQYRYGYTPEGQAQF
jgi:hypothetical protein